MRIEWTIEKKRGNLRPMLRYSVTLEEHEKALALPGISVLSCIPEVEEERQEYCYPGQYERTKIATTGIERQRRYLEIPSHVGHSWTHSLRLPWRKDNDYPEVETSFRLLREAFEKELAAAYASKPMRAEGSLETSAPAKANIAPGILGERFLRSAAQSALKAG
ncbi:hypothetical protein LJC59_05180 [Desulfovibrio sp. OttesenSCG-928-A18]|nr:hypothetical protein [Desulfovibrio sp. OttesenSCG-928-A18]